MKLIKIILWSSLLMILFNGCASVKSGLEGGKRSSSEEFLVKKKNPLVMPPSYDSLPQPKTKDTVVEENNFELQKILDKNVSTKKSKTSTNTGNNSLEESILKKINVN